MSPLAALRDSLDKQQERGKRKMPQGIHPRDLTDDEWEKIQLLLPQDKPVGKHREVDWRGVAE